DKVRSYAAPLLLKRERVNLGKLIRDAWRNLEPLRRGRETRLEESAAYPNLDCVADPLALGQVFRNIMENSLSACADPVVVRLACAEVQCKGRSALRVSL